MKLRKLRLKDKKTFDRFLHIKRHELSVYTFGNIYSWSSLFEIVWDIIDDSLCVFFQDTLGSFLYCAPLAEKIKPETIPKIFNGLDSLNRTLALSRIENVEENEVAWYRSLGYVCEKKFPEYLCRSAALAHLRGDRFKSKRAAYNYFIKHYLSEYVPYTARYKDECLSLYAHWMEERFSRNADPVYQGMMKDSLTSLSLVLSEHKKLDIAGRLVLVGKKVKAFTFGYKVNEDTFCVFFEITDISLKGVSQYIFREFCRELSAYTYINIMDDSGLENLKQVKYSYRPAQLIPSYIVKRNDA